MLFFPCHYQCTFLSNSVQISCVILRKKKRRVYGRGRVCTIYKTVQVLRTQGIWSYLRGIVHVCMYHQISSPASWYSSKTLIQLGDYNNVIKILQSYLCLCDSELRSVYLLIKFFQICYIVYWNVYQLIY